MNLTIIPSIGNCPELNTGLRRGKGGRLRGVMERWDITLRHKIRNVSEGTETPTFDNCCHTRPHTHTHTPACGLSRVWRATGLNHCFCQEQFFPFFSHTTRGHRCRLFPSVPQRKLKQHTVSSLVFIRS